MKTLVAYFSCSGETKKVAIGISKLVNGDIYEIEPEIPYTSKDLDWQDKKSRSTIEMEDKDSRPKIKNKLDNMDEYSTIYLGFPIWWYVAPRIINTFLESYDLSNKKIVLFCTSGGSSIDNSYNELKKLYDLNLVCGEKLGSYNSLEDLENFINEY